MQANSERVAYLERVYARLAADLAAPADAVITVGWPSKKPRAANARIGECDYRALASGRILISISPAACTDVYTACGTLLHEAIHAANPNAGHKGAFGKVARHWGLEGKLTSTVAGPVARNHIDNWATGLGEWPAEGTNPPQAKVRKGSRLRLWECECPVKVRVASDEFDATCGGCGEAFKRVG